MSEENRWDEDLPEVNENVPTEEKPLDTFGNTDIGTELKEQVADLESLLAAYRSGQVIEKL